jgi:hypothetical protein
MRPLALGQELKFLLRAVPSSQLAIEPAASLRDVASAVESQSPRFLHFSGHSVSVRARVEPAAARSARRGAGD